MKLIVAGSTGFVATEVIRQALSNPDITSIVALGRRPAAIPSSLDTAANTTKLNSVILKDFDNEYPAEVTKELSGADACIWTIAVLPSQYKSMPWEHVVKICRDYPVRGLETISQLAGSAEGKKPLRFIYVSGALAERDQTKKPMMLGEYCLLRGEAETHLLEAARKLNGTVQAGIAKPGLITENEGLIPMIKRTMLPFIGLPAIRITEIAAALIDQAVNGLEKDTLLNEDMVRIAHQK
ncbi:hypothetical protein VTI74DRAFT_7495 [Chaetomium olivicolor]